MLEFTRAITRLPGENLFKGLTTAGLGPPDLEIALLQHQAYRNVLSDCGLDVKLLPEDLDHPDSTFVEDTAILTPECAIITRPGAASRSGEVDAIRPVIVEYFDEVHAIQAPGTLDGGDVCDAGEDFLIGVSDRTNENGARQLADILKRFGHRADLIDITHKPGLLHLKSGLAWLGNLQLAVIPVLVNEPQLSRYHLTRVPEGEEYAANCLLVNDRILVAKGYPIFTRSLEALGYPVKILDMSEFHKMDGGLSCLSLRF